LSFPQASARSDAWGRLTRLTSGGAELSTAARLLKDEGVVLAFELGGDAFDGVRARVAHAEDDDDGFRTVELRFVDEVQRRRLAKALTDLLARS
jgi:hypothetical protein